MWVSDYGDPDNATKKTKEQIDKEKAAVGGSVIRVRKEGDTWTFVESEKYNRRIDATTPMVLTGPAAGSDGMTMFLAVQHPGEETEDKDNPTSTWPHDGDNVPKPSVVAITSFV